MTLALQEQESGIYRHVAVPSRDAHQIKAVPLHHQRPPSCSGREAKEVGTMPHLCPLLAFRGQKGAWGTCPGELGVSKSVCGFWGAPGQWEPGQPQGSSHRRKWGSGGPGGLGGLCRGLEGAMAQQERGRELRLRGHPTAGSRGWAADAPHAARLSVLGVT